MNKTSESRLKAQKRYDDKNRDKKREYDKKRWKTIKNNKQIIEKIKKYVLENTYLDLANSRCWMNKHSAEYIGNLLKLDKENK